MTVISRIVAGLVLLSASTLVSACAGTQPARTLVKPMVEEFFRHSVGGPGSAHTGPAPLGRGDAGIGQGAGCGENLSDDARPRTGQCRGPDGAWVMRFCTAARTMRRWMPTRKRHGSTEIRPAPAGSRAGVHSDAAAGSGAGALYRGIVTWTLPTAGRRLVAASRSICLGGTTRRSPSIARFWPAQPGNRAAANNLALSWL